MILEIFVLLYLVGCFLTYLLLSTCEIKVKDENTVNVMLSIFWLPLAFVITALLIGDAIKEVFER